MVINQVKWKTLLLLTLIFGAANSVAVETKTDSSQGIRVAYVEVQDASDPVYYYQQLLKLVLDKTIDEGEYHLEFLDELPSIDRIRYMVQSGSQMDLMWASVTPDRVKTLRLIPFDLLRGYNNFKLLVIKIKSQNRVSAVKNFADFKKLKAGNGTNWTATRVLEANGIRVVTTVSYSNLLKMLAAGRFDYVLHGLHEVHSDADLFKTNNFGLKIDDHLLIKYEYPVDYSFFVAKNNKQLAERIYRGLKIAEADGSLDQLFVSIPAFKFAMDELAKNRVEISVDNSKIYNE